jgi:hypothetical protein
VTATPETLALWAKIRGELEARNYSRPASGAGVVGQLGAGTFGVDVSSWLGETTWSCIKGNGTTRSAFFFICGGPEFPRKERRSFDFILCSSLCVFTTGKGYSFGQWKGEAIPFQVPPAEGRGCDRGRWHILQPYCLLLLMLLLLLLLLFFAGVVREFMETCAVDSNGVHTVANAWAAKLSHVDVSSHDKLPADFASFFFSYVLILVFLIDALCVPACWSL